VEIAAQVRIEHLDALIVNARRALIGSDVPVRFQHPSLGYLKRLGRCHGLFLVAELAHAFDRTTPPLCSTSITDASTLVPVAPSLTGASIFLLVVLPLVVSLHIARQLSRVPQGSRYGIHDISRTELDKNNLPRFNMPLELGIFMGAKRFGPRLQKDKRLLIFDTEKYRYQKFISDIAGMDIHAHNADAECAINQTRDWLANVSRRQLPGARKLVQIGTFAPSFQHLQISWI
jgi:hypothetical protein